MQKVQKPWRGDMIYVFNHYIIAEMACK